MSGPFDFLHIKGRTAGSSNELSFDVLDAARSGIGPQKGRRSKPSGPKPSQGSYHGVAGTSTLSAVPEVERRKKARRARAVRFWAIAIVAVVALAGSAGYFGWRLYQDRLDFHGRFNALVDRLTEVDQTLVEVDGLMDDLFDVTAQEDRSRVSDRFTQLDRDLNSISAEARELAADAQGDDDKASLSAVELATDARQGMISSAQAAFELSARANGFAVMVQAEWDKVLEGDALARSAAEVANAASTEEATLDARSQTAAAIDRLKEAAEGLDSLDRQIPRAGLSAEKGYIDKRVEALSAAIETADALIDGDREGAAQANDAYNRADREAARLASNLPPSVEVQVKASFQEEMDSLSGEYDESRSSAATADSTIRTYL